VARARGERSRQRCIGERVPRERKEVGIYSSARCHGSTVMPRLNPGSLRSCPPNRNS